MNESPLFSKFFDFMAWVIPMTVKFPKEHRFVLAESVQRVVLAAHEAVTRAGFTKDFTAIARELDQVALYLNLTRFYLRLAVHMTLITLKQHEFAAGSLAEIGRIVESWKQKNSTNQKEAEEKEAKKMVPGAVTG